MDIKISFL